MVAQWTVRAGLGVWSGGGGSFGRWAGRLVALVVAGGSVGAGAGAGCGFDRRGLGRVHRLICAPDVQER